MYGLAVSARYGLATPEPVLLVVDIETCISCSGRVSVSGPVFPELRLFLGYIVTYVTSRVRYVKLIKLYIYINI